MPPSLKPSSKQVQNKVKSSRHDYKPRMNGKKKSLPSIVLRLSMKMKQNIGDGLNLTYSKACASPL
jgi:hypothetical protein